MLETPQNDRSRTSPAADEDAGASAQGEPQLGGTSPPRKRNDTISPIVVIVVVLFWVLQSSFTSIAARVFHAHKSPVAHMTGSNEFTSSVATGLLEIDAEAKMSYLGAANPAPNRADSEVTTRRPDGAVTTTVVNRTTNAQLLNALEGSSSMKTRQRALTEAAKLLASNPSQPSLARRVILLRAESGDPNPLGLPQLAGNAKTASGKPAAKPLNPLAAYAPIKGEAATPAKIIADERTVMVELFSTKEPISARQEALIQGQIRRLPQMRWWGKLALHQAAVRAGDARGAATGLRSVRREALGAVIGTSTLSILTVAAVLIGVLCLIIFLIRFMAAREQPGYTDAAAPAPVDHSILAERAPLITDDQRRLGAGDLANLFCLYLALMTGLGFAVSQAPGDVLRRIVLALPYEQQLTATILLEFVFTGLCGVVTFAAMFWLAKRRGADLSREIGLNLGGRSLLRTLAFGFLGWAISLPISLVVSLLGRSLLHGAPEPANPVIPMIMTAPTGWPTLLIYILAAFVAPLFEETMFRGLFFNAARLRLGTVGGILLTGAAFGLAHPVGIAEQIVLGTLGAVLAWMAYTKKSLMPGMVAHFFQNTLAFGQVVLALSFVMPPHLFWMG